MENNISVFLARTPWVVGAIFLGVAGCLALHKGKYRDFFTSPLFIKIVMWLPIYVIFCLVGSSTFLAVVFAILLIAVCVYEWKRRGKLSVVWYLGYFIVGCLTLPISLSVMGARLWMTVVMASVLSDVAAFFFGKTIGRHHLPDSLNSRKSIEGVIGQVVGGVVGILITSSLFETTVPWWMGFAVGVLSAMGDLANSYTKRKLGITDWGGAIPGHGGVMDRFSSLNAVLIGITILQVITLLL